MVRSMPTPLIVFSAGPVNPPTEETRDVVGLIPTPLIVFSAGPVNPPAEETRAVSGLIPTPLIVFSAGPVNPPPAVMRPVVLIDPNPDEPALSIVTPFIVPAITLPKSISAPPRNLTPPIYPVAPILVEILPVGPSVTPPIVFVDVLTVLFIFPEKLISVTGPPIAPGTAVGPITIVPVIGSVSNVPPINIGPVGPVAPKAGP